MEIEAEDLELINKYSNINDYSKYKVNNQLVDVTQKGNYIAILPKINNLAKFKPEITLINQFKNKNDINSNNIIYNSGRGDSWFQSISQALYSDEIYYTTIRKKIYEVFIIKNHIMNKIKQVLKMIIKLYLCLNI